MQRLELILVALIGTGIAGGFGLAAGIIYDEAILAWIVSAVLPVIVLIAAGVRDRKQLLKVAGYALLGWGLCFLLEPASSQSSMSRARRLSKDSFAGKAWYIPCYFVSGIMVCVGIGFVPVDKLKNRSS